MADSLVLKGYRDVKKHAGSEMQIISPPRGGQKYPVKKWWSSKGTASYVPCAVFAVTYGVDTCYLALNVAEMSTLRVDHLDAFEFRFSIFTGTERAALFTDSWELIEHYLFPRISGGKVVTVTPPGAAAKPDGSAPVPDTTVDSVSVSGEFTVTAGDNKSYTATVVGDATPFSYSWSITGGAIDSGDGTDTAVVTWGGAGSGTITCLAGSTNANFDGNTQTDTRNVTIAAAPPPAEIDEVSVSGEQSPTVGTSHDYTAVPSGTTSDFTYTWTVGFGGTINSGDGTNQVNITWNSVRASTVTCEVGSTDETWNNVTQDDTLDVNISAAPPATGPVTAVTLVGDTTTQSSGSVSATATTSPNGIGLTVTYDSDGSNATNLAIAEAGSGYQEGDSFTVDGDTGVTGTISITTTTAVATETGPKAVDGYYPLYDLDSFC